MQFLSCPPNKGMEIIDDYLSKRIQVLKGKDRDAIVLEFKEWILEENSDGDEIWTIPDLTDEGLLDFFMRAISRK
jgi:hypothetical protein|tara:strand:- start:9 stop:233 length:225 start_codon:yes stop_codon:yes gene_type:complete